MNSYATTLGGPTGYYAAQTNQPNTVTSEFTATDHSSMGQFTFPQGSDAGFDIKLQAAITHGRIQDVLLLVMKTKTPLFTATTVLASGYASRLIAATRRRTSPGQFRK